MAWEIAPSKTFGVLTPAATRKLSRVADGVSLPLNVPKAHALFALDNVPPDQS